MDNCHYTYCTYTHSANVTSVAVQVLRFKQCKVFESGCLFSDDKTSIFVQHPSSLFGAAVMGLEWLSVADASWMSGLLNTMKTVVMVIQRSGGCVSLVNGKVHCLHCFTGCLFLVLFLRTARSFVRTIPSRCPNVGSPDCMFGCHLCSGPSTVIQGLWPTYSIV